MGQFSEFYLTLIATLSITAIMSYGGMYVLHPVPTRRQNKKRIKKECSVRTGSNFSKYVIVHHNITMIIIGNISKK